MQGGVAPIDAWATMRGLHGRPGTGGIEQFEQNLAAARGGTFNTIQELLNRGATLQQLGQLPGPAGWGETHLAGVPAMEAVNLTRAPVGAAGYSPTGTAAGEETMRQAFLSPGVVNEATGGSIPSLLAALDPARFAAAGGQFGFGGPLAQEALAAQQAYADLVNQQAYQEFTSGGG